MEIDSGIYKVYYFSDRGSKRRLNQDNLYINGCVNLLCRPSVEGEETLDTQTMQVVALFDGMGGETDGEKAAFVAAETMEYFCRAMGNIASKETVKQALQEYYQAYLNTLEEMLEDEEAVSGTTCTAILLDQQQLIPFWVGDSRAYLLRNGVLTRLTKDHTLAQIAIDQGELSEEEAKKTRSWHMLTSYMGQPEEEFEVGEAISIRAGDMLFLCSDGITDAFTDAQLQQWFEKEPAVWIDEMKKWAKENADDNCTGIAIYVEQEPVLGSGEEEV